MNITCRLMMGGAEIVSEEWQGAYVIIDPTHHMEGQRVSIENDMVGKPLALLKSLVSALNERHEKPYHIEIEPLFDASRFWSFSAKHDNILKSVQFDFVVPNMWGTESDLAKDLRETGQVTGAERVAVSMRAENGISTLNQKVRDGVEYAEKGAGTVKARAMDGQYFSSTRRLKTIKIPAFDFSREAAHRYLSQIKNRILGHEQNYTVDRSDRISDNSADD